MIVTNSTSARGGGVNVWDDTTFRTTIINYNHETNGAHDLHEGAALYEFCCTVPPVNGPDTIAGEPRFRSVGSDWRLATNSPCIDAEYHAGGWRGHRILDGLPRVACGLVDMGAYEPTSAVLRCALAGTPLVGGAPLQVTFSAVVPGGNTQVTFDGWDFNNDGAEDSDEQHPSWVYWTAGVYSVRLSVSNYVGLGVGQASTLIRTNCVVITNAVHDVHYVSPNGAHVMP